MLEQLSQVLIAMANGALSAVSAATNLRTLLVLATLVSLGWLAAVEVEDLDRSGYKPTIRRH